MQFFLLTNKSNLMTFTLSGQTSDQKPGLEIATVLVAFATKFSPFTTETSSEVTTLRPVFT